MGERYNPCWESEKEIEDTAREEDGGNHLGEEEEGIVRLISAIGYLST